MLSDICDVAIEQLRHSVPFALFALYINDPTTDELELAFADGEGMSLVLGLRIPLAQRLSGWVAVNRQVVANSDAALDFGDLARTLEPALVSCLAAPLVSNGQLAGVLTLYSTTANAFSEDHRRVVEGVSDHIAAAVLRIAEHGPERTGQIDIEAIRPRS
jgi:GAF domain-containing protein